MHGMVHGSAAGVSAGIMPCMGAAQKRSHVRRFGHCMQGPRWCPSLQRWCTSRQSCSSLSP
jgi:hypothetical protein